MWWVYDLTKSRSHTARKMKFSIKDLFSGKLHFLCSVHYKFALGLSSNSSVLTHFMQLVSFYTPSKHQKAKGTRGIKCVSVSFLHVNLCTSVPCPVYTGSKLNVHKTFRRRPGRPLNVLCTFNYVSTGWISFPSYKTLQKLNFFVGTSFSFLLEIFVMKYFWIIVCLCL